MRKAACGLIACFVFVGAVGASLPAAVADAPAVRLASVDASNSSASDGKSGVPKPLGQEVSSDWRLPSDIQRQLEQSAQKREPEDTTQRRRELEEAAKGISEVLDNRRRAKGREALSTMFFWVVAMLAALALAQFKTKVHRSTRVVIVIALVLAGAGAYAVKELLQWRLDHPLPGPQYVPPHVGSR